MNASGVSHIALCVRDMDRSVSFYRDILGMNVTFDGQTDPSEGGRMANYKHPRQTRRRVSLAFGDNAMPSLTLTSHPGEPPDGAPIQLDQLGITHFSFRVPDAKALAAELMAKGAELAGSLEDFTNAQGNITSFYVKDPDGILVQFDSGAGG